MDDTTKQILTDAVGGLIRHGLGVAAGIFISLGWISQGDSVNFVNIATGIVLGAIAYGWSQIQKRNQRLHVAGLRAMMAMMVPKTTPPSSPKGN